MRRKRTTGVRTGLLVACLFLLSGCSFSLSLWVVSGSLARHLILGISTRRYGLELVRPSSIRVYRCADIYYRGNDRGYYPPDRQLVWSASSRPDSGLKPTTRITYGAAPAGLKNDVAPHELEIPGCYVVHAYAYDPEGDSQSATGGFDVLPNGRIQELSEDALKRIFSPRKPVN
jgi:hypothetical protein